jgi:sugar phosphate isomerase/epimerase
VADGVAALVPTARELGVRLGIEALHPMFCADRCVVSSLGEALALAERFPADTVGVIVDTYHLWWDASVPELIGRAGDRIFSYQISDWRVPLPADTLLGRAHVGDGSIDFGPMTDAVVAAGYAGDIEVEIFNEDIWSAPTAETIAKVRKGFLAAISSGRHS